MKDFDMWVYHETEKPKIIKQSALEDHKEEGWADSPARFIKLDTIGISQLKIDNGDEEESTKAQQALDAVEGVVASLNGALNLDSFTKKELEAYALDHFGVDIDKRKTRKSLLVEVRKLTEA